MKLYPIILLLVAGCAVPKPVTPPTPAMSPRAAVTAQGQSSVVPQPVTFSFGSNPAWRDWVIESSTDLIHWRNRRDLEASPAMWPDGTNWTVVVPNQEQQEFFRTVGDL